MNDDTISIGGYLARRLIQLDCAHVFGVPGDFNLALLDELLLNGLAWVGTANELNASYAADGYARIRRGVSAYVTTYGVGELSAINGSAGSFAEDVPVVHVVGLPDRAARMGDLPLHHTLADGDHDHFLRMAREVNAAVEVVHSADSAAGTIDRALEAALARSKPVYLGIPSDVAERRISSAALRRPLRKETSEPPSLDLVRNRLASILEPTAQVALLVGVRAHRRRAEEAIRRIAEVERVCVATQLSSKGILSESHAASLGLYMGALTPEPDSRAAVESADVLISVGTVSSDFLTGFFTQALTPRHHIEIHDSSVRIDGDTVGRVQFADAMAIVEDMLASTRGARPVVEAVAPDVFVPAAGPLDHESFWGVLQPMIRENTIIAAEAGTAFYGAVDLRLPEGCELLGQPIWSSIGYTLPALLGGMLARQDRRGLLLIGDGAAQLTVQDLGTFFRNELRPTIVVLNNRGYTIERMIRSPEAAYQDVDNWSWPAIPAAFGHADVYTTSVQSIGELRDALARAAESASGALIEVMLPRDDAPPRLRQIVEALRRSEG